MGGFGVISGDIALVEANTSARNAEAARAGLPSMAQAYGAALRRLIPGLALRVIEPFAGAKPVFEGCAGIIFTGSTESFATTSPEAAPLRGAMEVAFTSGVPIFGSCNGMQLAATVLGGEIGPSETFELGLARDITLTKAGRAHPMFADKPARFAAAAIHRDQVTRLPSGAIHLAGNAHSPHQAFAYEAEGIRYWGAQYHPELRPGDIADILAARDGLFDTGTNLVADMRAIAEGDTNTAARWGTTPAAMRDTTRMSELTAFLRQCGAFPLSGQSARHPEIAART